MATISRADAVWEGDLMTGKGRVKVASGAFNEFGVTWASRADREKGGTSPEELIAAAHAGCFSMALSNGLAKAGHPPTRVDTTASVHLDKGEAGFSITRIDLRTEAEVPGIDEAAFAEQAEAAKKGCPVSKA